MFLFGEIATIKDHEVGQELTQKLSDYKLKAVNTFVFQQTGQENYFKEGSTWGDVKKGFEDLKLDFNSFLKWYEQQRLEELNAKRASFTVRGGSKSILAAQAISSTKEEQRKEIAERTERIKKERQEDRFA